MAPNGLAGGGAIPIALSGVLPRDVGISSGDKQRPDKLRGDAGIIGELHVLVEPPVVNDAKLDCDGDGVRIKSLLIDVWAVVNGDELRISKEAARNGDGERLLVLELRNG